MPQPVPALGFGRGGRALAALALAGALLGCARQEQYDSNQRAIDQSIATSDEMNDNAAAASRPTPQP